MIEIIREFITEYTEELYCPYCGEEQSESWDYDDKGITICDKCEKQFSYWTETIRHFNSEKMGNDND